MNQNIYKIYRCLAIAILTVCFSSISFGAEGRVVFRQDFSAITNLNQAGWVQHGGEDVSDWELKNKSLEMTFAHKPYKGGKIVHKIPSLESGELTVDMTVHTGNEKYNHLSLQMKLYDLMFAFKKLSGHHDMFRYHDNKMIRVCSSVPIRHRFTLRITFDNRLKIVQYFIDDMTRPVLIEENMTLSPGDSPEFLIANYGLALGTLTHQIHSIELSETPPETDDAGRGGIGSVATSNLQAEGPIVFQQDFSAITNLNQAGWVQHGGEDVSAWELKNKSLEMTFAHKPYKGGEIVHKIPALESGELTVDMTVHTGNEKYNHLSLQMKLYDLMFAFKKLSGHDMFRYHDNKMIRVCSSVPIRRRFTLRITFDNRLKIVQYFIDDMTRPVLIEENMTLSPGNSPEFLIANYGLALGTLTHQIHSIDLRKISPPTDDAGSYGVMPHARLFRGIASDRYRLPSLVKELGVQEGSVHTLINRSAALTPQNQFAIDKLPAIGGTSVPQYIIMADFSLNEGVLPEISVKSLISDVRRGSTLVILGGLFTLNKGEFNKSQLNAIVPVETSDPWGIKIFNPPLTTTAGVISQVHDVVLKENAKVLADSNGSPLWVEGEYGKGRVIVFTGMPCGIPADTLTPFWLHPSWPNHAASIISGK